MPARVGAVPWVGAGVGLLRDPTRFFARARRRHGDTFVVDAFGYRLFCVFSPAGVRRLYELPEREASFGLATYRLIGFKLPLELLSGRRNGPHHLFGNQRVEGYLDNLQQAVDVELNELGDDGSFEVFREAKRLGHRLGFASWAGIEAASPRYLDRLIPLFDRIDSSEAFVRPAQAFRTWATRRARERRAMHDIERVVAEIWAERRAAGIVRDDFLEQLVASYDDLTPDEAVVGAARDVIMLHVGAQSNLYAALAWTLVNVLRNPAYAARDPRRRRRTARAMCERVDPDGPALDHPPRGDHARRDHRRAAHLHGRPGRVRHDDAERHQHVRRLRDSTSSTPTTTTADGSRPTFRWQPRSS